ncbi:MAG TPA: DUF427 domain-containing protein [Candidatus Nanoarchaeia archaeon]|nr:DUF427 domain-containing protein [Candidatus Nanoarchaeia archaeon]
MPKAIWNGTVIAESSDCFVVDGVCYFPPGSVRQELLKPSGDGKGLWKGEARYYTIEAGGKQNPDAAWQLPVPKDDQRHIRGYFAFWKGVEIIP